MLNFAKQILRGGSGNGTGKSVTERVGADFFALEGGNWQSLSDQKCKVTFESGEKSGPSLVVSCESESVHEVFSLDSISNLSRFVDEEGKQCFQWIVRKGKGGENMEEFGLRFEKPREADDFAAEFALMGQQTATVLAEFRSSEGLSIDLLEKVSETEWDVVEEGVLVILSKTKKAEHYLSIQKGEEYLFHSAMTNSLQIELKYPLMAFLGFTPLHEDLRVLGIRLENKVVFEDLVDAISLIQDSEKNPKCVPPRIITSESSSASSSDAEMWFDSEEYRAAPVRARRQRRYKANNSSGDDETEREEINRHLRMGHREKSRAVVFSNRSGEGGFRVFNAQSPPTKTKKLESVSNFNRINLNPSSVMMHQGDAKVLMLDPSLGRDKVFELDLERGKVVNEWTPGLETSVNSILPVSKTVQGDASETTFLAINEKAIFLMDPRQKTDSISGNRVRTFNYATNVKLSAAATDSNSRIVVTNKTGQFRLFDGESNKDGDFKRAKTLLAGLGDPITHVEITNDGEWILATCATYLLLINTISSEGISGFVKSIGSSAHVITLALSHHDIAKHKLACINFTGAKFDEVRNLIVTSTGSLAILWDFAKIKRGSHVYSIKPMRDFILDAQIVQGAETVVAMYEHKLELAHVRK